MAVEKRLMHYASFDTQSREESTSAPSTEKQLILARELKAECEKLGFDSVELCLVLTALALVLNMKSKNLDALKCGGWG